MFGEKFNGSPQINIKKMGIKEVEKKLNCLNKSIDISHLLRNRVSKPPLILHYIIGATILNFTKPLISSTLRLDFFCLLRYS